MDKNDPSLSNNHSINGAALRTYHVTEYVCDTCSLRCRTRQQYDSHVLIHQDARPYPCPHCGVRFRRKGHLQGHLLLHSGLKPFPCPLCDRNFRHKNSLKNHVLTHSGRKDASCEICDRKFTCKADLDSHKRRVHAERERKYKCSGCDKAFFSKQSLSVHARMHSDVKDYKCHMCEAAFTRADYLRAHINAHTGARPYECVRCSKSYPSKSSLTTHVQTHHQQRPRAHYECTTCGKTFTTARAQRFHVSQVCQRAKTLSCSLCRRMFKHEVNLKVHMKFHDDTEPYKCEFCDAGFRTDKSLQKHFRVTHMGDEDEDTLPCEFCDAKFLDKIELKKHLTATHADQMRFTCKHCKKAFRRVTAYREHIARHRSKRHACSTCHATFAAKTIAQRHMREVHAAPQPFPCEFCDTAFKRGDALKAHIRKKHT